MKLEHVALWVENLENMTAFYEKYFGGKRNEKYHNPRTGMSSYFLTFEDGARLELMHRSDIPSNLNQKHYRGIIHVAFSLKDKAAVDRQAAWFKAEGLPIVRGPRVTGDGYYEFETLDPEGNRLEVICHPEQ